MKLTAWSNQSAQAELSERLSSRNAPLDLSALSCVYAAGRSYSDLALPGAGVKALLTRGMDRLASFNDQSGEMRIEAGASLQEALDVATPRGWMLPVVPGTGAATVGGAIANDAHGKNQASQGSFGSCVASLRLARSDLGVIELSRSERPELFAATLGGLGATGVILDATLQLRRVGSPWMSVSQRRFDSLEEFFELDSRLRSQSEYTVGWLDCLSARGRGVYFTGDHDNAGIHLSPEAPKSRLSAPITPPISLVNGLSVRALNQAYWMAHADKDNLRQHYKTFFFPLDGIENWNRMYGKRGFFQYQCLLPNDLAQEGLERLLGICRKLGEGSFLAVLKTFGPQGSPATMSFAREGVSFAMDFANKGAKTLAMMESFDRIVSELGGALYPAKDGRMSEQMFKRSFPAWESWWAQRDPALIGSLFLKRAMGAQWESK